MQLLFDVGETFFRELNNSEKNIKTVGEKTNIRKYYRIIYYFRFLTVIMWEIWILKFLENKVLIDSH